MILFFQRLIGHWVLLHFNLTHIIFCALFAYASFSKIFILKTFVCKRSCANVQRYLACWLVSESFTLCSFSKIDERSMGTMEESVSSIRQMKLQDLALHQAL